MKLNDHSMINENALNNSATMLNESKAIENDNKIMDSINVSMVSIQKPPSRVEKQEESPLANLKSENFDIDSFLDNISINDPTL